MEKILKHKIHTHPALERKHNTPPKHVIIDEELFVEMWKRQGRAIVITEDLLYQLADLFKKSFKEVTILGCNAQEPTKDIIQVAKEVEELINKHIK